MVTHDRYFLDRVCSEIIEIDNRQLYSYKGNYSYYLEKRQERIEATNAEIARANNLYRTELEWMRRMPQARGHKARYREEAFYELEKVAKQRTYDANVKLDVKASYIGSKIFEADHLCKRFGDLKILDDFSYIFARYEKMGIVGNNGTGKSTFIKILMGLEKPDSGTLDIGETVRFGYYSQEGLQFNEQMKVIDVITDIAEVIEPGQRQTADGFTVPAAFPLHARNAAQLCVQVERGRTTPVVPLYGTDAEPELPGTGRADQRPGHRYTAGAGRIPAELQGMRHRGEPRPLLHGQGSRPSAGIQRAGRHPRFPRQLF